MRRVAIVHDWLTGMRGGERVLEALLDLFPRAEIFTLLHVPGSVSARIEQRPIHTSFVGRLPRAADLYRYYLPLFPAAVERFDLNGFDLIVSSSHCVAKSARHPPDVPHLCYCHTPMRYVWDLYGDYFGPGRARPWVRGAMAVVAPRLRRWDVRTAGRVDAFVAICRHIAERIRRCYGRMSAVVYPPVQVERFRPAAWREGFYLMVSALVPYKRVDLAIQAFHRLGRKLVIVGDGPEMPRLRDVAGKNIVFTGWVSDEEVADWMGRCRAFVFPGEEDFGIAAVEAQAAGAPVIAYAKGGALETVIGVDGNRPDGDSRTRPTGVFFHEPTAGALVDAVRRFESLRFEVDALRANARRFEVRLFHERMREQVERLVEGARSGAPGACPRPSHVRTPGADPIPVRLSAAHPSAATPRSAPRGDSAERVRARPWQDERPPRRILAIRLHAAGDAVITLPALRGVRARFSEARIDFLTLEENAEIPRSLVVFDRVYGLGGGRSHRRHLLAAVLLLPVLLRRRYEVVLDLQNNRVSRLVRRALRPAAWSEFDRFSPNPAGERVRWTVEAAGLSVEPVLARPALRDAECGLELLRSGGWTPHTMLVVLNPAGAFPSRNWPLENYARFAELFRRACSRPARFLLLGLPAMAAKARTLAARLDGSAIDLVGKTSPAQAFAILQQAVLVVSEDSALMHMAWTSGIPTVALLGSTRGDWARPLGAHSVCLDSGDLPCGYCMERECRFGDTRCLTRRLPERIAEVALELLRRRGEAL